MKKMFFALAALVLAFTGCSQEEDAIQVSEKKAVKVVVNMDKPGFGEDTRAPRTGWEEGDVVGIILNNDFEHVLFLNYSGTTWESESFFLEVEGSDKYYTYDEDDDCNPTPEHEAKKADYFSNIISPSGSLKAIYCSSGLYYFDPIFEDDELVGTQYLSYASHDEENLMGECIMTCEDGTYGVEETADGYVLTLNITMIPQVAQFTIRDLLAGTGANTGKLADGGEVGVVGLVTYSGGTITPTGIELNQVAAAGYNPCWVHPNTDGINPVGISIYAAVDSSYEPDDDSDFIQFSVDDENGYYVRNFSSYDTYKEEVTNGAAIIMDGPTTSGAEGKWSEPA